MAKILGIDLGTTNSVVAIIEAGDTTVLENAEGARLTPSVAAINPKSSERLVGLVAKRQAIANPEGTIFSIKRFMGRKYSDPLVQEAIRHVPYHVEAADNDDVQVRMGDRSYSPPEISAMILQKLKQDAEAKLGEKITRAVITVPAYFNDSQRQATKDAGTIAGLDVLRIINEPTAAALAYGGDKKNAAEQIIVVYDLGGGTFDVSVLRIADGVFEVIATNGNTYLGGDDFDRAIIDWIATDFERENRIDLRKDRLALQRLKEAAEKAKIELSTLQQTEINLPFITADASGPKHLTLTLTRAKLEQLVGDLIEKTIGPCRQALQDAHLQPNQIHEVVLVGGMTRMPAVIRRVRDFFGRDPNHSVNPDEVVAVGAAIQGGVLQGDVKDVLLLDVTPLSLAIETLGGVATRLIERNTTIPTSKSQIFSTATDNQSQVEIHVVQGERPLAGDNKSLGRFVLAGIPPAPRGIPQIEVKFDIDANGILSISARDTASGREQKMIIQATSGLSSAEIDKMVRDAEAYAAQDQARREEIELRNRADTVCYETERQLQEYQDRMPDDIRTRVTAAISEVRKCLENSNLAALRAAVEELDKARMEIGAHAYAANDASQREAATGAADGEFREL